MMNSSVKNRGGEGERKVQVGRGRGRSRERSEECENPSVGREEEKRRRWMHDDERDECNR